MRIQPTFFLLPCWQKKILQLDLHIIIKKKKITDLPTLMFFGMLPETQVFFFGLMALSNKLCSGLSIEKAKMIGNQIMKWKMNDARSVLKQHKRSHTKIWRENEEIPRHYSISELFFVIWEQEKVERRNELEEKRETYDICLYWNMDSRSPKDGSQQRQIL